MKLSKWTRISQKTLFKNDHWEYKLDNFKIDGGIKGEYHYVHSPGSTMAVPFSDDESLLLVEQYRYLNQKASLEFPCGAVTDGLSREDNALKEMREETGYSGELRLIGEFSPYTGAADEICTVFLADNLIFSPLKPDETEEFNVVELSISQFEKLIKENSIWDGLTLSAWTLVKSQLNI